MADITPKINQFIFIGIVCMLINLSACIVTFAMNQTADIGSYTVFDTDTGLEETDVEVENFIAIAGASVGSAWLPFVDLISLTFLETSENSLFMTFVFIIVGVFGAIKLYLLIIIVLNFIPTVNV